MRKIKSALVFISIGLSLASPCYAEWAISYGGLFYESSASSIQETFDQHGNPDGYIVAGESIYEEAGPYVFIF